MMNGIKVWQAWLVRALVLLCLGFTPLVSAESAESAEVTGQEVSEEEAEYMAWATAIWEKLDQRSGLINLPGANVTLNVPEAFYFLGPEDSKTVLEEVWGNPPDDSTLGMLFPAEGTPFDPDIWGVTIEYVDDGYVSDEDAVNINYDELLDSMQQDMLATSEARVAAGYDAISLVGWASSPYYDSAAHKLHWAQELSFAGSETNTLNYDIRILGRRGVLRMSFIADISQLETIKNNVDAVLDLAEFDAGSTYAEFDSSMDKVAAYGIGALVAGKVLAKTGFIAAALIFLKKFGLIILIAVGAFVGRLFKKKPKDEDSTQA